MGGDLSGELLRPCTPGTARGLCPASTTIQDGGCCSMAWCLLAAVCLCSSAASCAVAVATRCWCLDQQEGTFYHCLWLRRSLCPSAAYHMEASLLPILGQRPLGHPPKSHQCIASCSGHVGAGPGERVNVQQYTSTARPLALDTSSQRPSLCF